MINITEKIISTTIAGVINSNVQDSFDASTIANLTNLTVTSNGTYKPSDFDADGFNQITIDIKPNDVVNVVKDGYVSVTNEDELYALTEAAEGTVVIVEN